MTTLNTIIEEEKPEDIEKWVRTLASSSNPRDIDLLIAKINVLRTTAIQRAYEAGEREADAKWEREVEGMKDIEIVDYHECYAFTEKNKTLDTLLSKIRS